VLRPILTLEFARVGIGVVNSLFHVEHALSATVATVFAKSVHSILIPPGREIGIRALRTQ
jgi:hypothetical protein